MSQQDFWLKEGMMAFLIHPDGQITEVRIGTPSKHYYERCWEFRMLHKTHEEAAVRLEELRRPSKEMKDE